MKKFAMSLLVLLLCILTWSAVAFATQQLVPVGQVIGLQLQDDRVVVAAFDEQLGQNAQRSGLQVGDQILQVDGKMIKTAEDVRKALDRSNGMVKIRFGRNGKCMEVQLQPQITTDGPKIGVFLKQGVTGIGTVTWYDPETGKFGTLGHGVNGSDGALLRMTGGTAYTASVVSVQQGKCGKPGQLCGAVSGAQPVGELKRNTARGVFGISEEGWQGQAIPVATAQEIKTGNASILSTVSGDGVREYSVEILKIYPKTRCEDKNLVIRITDPALLEATGGIVQGMSGSPIIQDGKLIGAVTHVLVNDPTRGYGIFIENMLDAAS